MLQSAAPGLKLRVVADADRSEKEREGGRAEIVFPADLDYAFRCPEGRLDVGCPGSLLRSLLPSRDTVIDPPSPSPPSGFGAKLDCCKEDRGANERRPSVRPVSFTSYLPFPSLPPS